MYINETPYFEIDERFEAPHGPITDQKGFSERIIEFITWNLNNKNRLDILCYLVHSDGTVMEAKLEDNSYLKSLDKCLEYYSGMEQYEECNNIKKLIKKYGLQ